ncbi:MAG: hypothetical protein JXR97_16005 [Planctomycetes bacterium]|nr:hypothetical protein [Planctomycetota bacterium]
MSKDMGKVNVDFAREALVTLSRQIREYCVNGRERVVSAHRNYRAGEAVRYVENAVKLTREMDKLLDMASGIGQMGDLDFESMETDVRVMKELVEAVAIRELWVQN